jgi:hypothetical protein
MLVGLIAGAPRALSAQVGVGGFVAREFDERNDWVLIGAEAEIPLHARSLSFNPRLSYHPYQDGSVVQIAANVLMGFTDPGSAKCKPFMGLGLSWLHDSYDPPGVGASFSESKIGLNFVAGARLDDPSWKLQPYIHTQYTAAGTYPNSFTLSIGALYTLKGK